MASHYPTHRYYMFYDGCSGGGSQCQGDETYLGRFYQVQGDCSNFRYYSKCGEFNTRWTRTKNSKFMPVTPPDSDGDGIADFEDSIDNKILVLHSALYHNNLDYTLIIDY